MPSGELGGLSQWALIGRRFRRHRLAVVSLYFLAVVYVLALGAGFFAPYPATWRDLDHAYAPPQLPRYSWKDGIHVLAMKRIVDPVTFRKSYIEDPESIVRLGFWVKGERYRLWGWLEWDE